MIFLSLSTDFGELIKSFKIERGRFIIIPSLVVPKTTFIESVFEVLVYISVFCVTNFVQNIGCGVIRATSVPAVPSETLHKSEELRD